MLRLWGKLHDRFRICQDYIAADERTDVPFEERFTACLEELLRELDLPRPIFLPQNEKELAEFRKTSFTQDHFMEHFPYKEFELDILETDDDEQE